VRERQPIFNVPGVVGALVLSFVGVHALRTVMPDEQVAWLTAVLAFIPARLSGLANDLPGGTVASATQFVTHMFVHGDWTHLAVNSAWLLAFGTPVARRIGWLRFITFFVLCGIAGALVYLAFSRGALNMMVGASGAISGLMGAAFRFLFHAFSVGDTESLAGRTAEPPLMSLAATFRDRRVLLTVIGWTVLNTVMAWGAAGLMDGASIAWEAHLGGFYMGLLAFGLFDRSPPIEHDAAPAE
jgi:membrane associated rhomboid family serine protease